MNATYAGSLVGQTFPTTPAPQTQAQIVIGKFGGEAKVAKLLHCARSTVYRWNYTRAEGGTNGMVPARALRRLLIIGPRLTPPVVITPADLYSSAGR